MSDSDELEVPPPPHRPESDDDSDAFPPSRFLLTAGPPVKCNCGHLSEAGSFVCEKCGSKLSASISAAPSPTNMSPPHSPTATLTTSASFLPVRASADGELTFANSLTHNFDHVSNQVGVGIKQTKTMTTLLKSIIEIQREAANKIIGLIDKEQRKQYEDEKAFDKAKSLLYAVTRDLMINPKGRDAMERFSKQFDKTLDHMRKEALQTLTDAHELDQKVVQPLMSHNVNNDGRLNALAKSEKQCRTEMAEASKLVKQKHEQTLKLIDEVVKAKAKDPTAPMTIQPTEAAKKKSVLSKVGHKLKQGQLISPKKLQKMAFSSAEETEKAVVAANARQEQFTYVDLPNLFTHLEELEASRLKEVSVILARYAEAKVAEVEPRFKLSTQLANDAKAMDGKKDMAEFILHLVERTGNPPPRVPFTYKIPCTPKDIYQGRFESSSLYFNNNLPNIMKLQQAKFPEEKVPHIVEVCIKSIADLGGFKVEGIFRISIPKEELDALVKQFDAGDYAIKGTNPHAGAALLKQWLRMLEDPVIPNFAQAMALGSSDKLDEAALAQFVKELPALNQDILRRIANGLVAEITKPENVEINKMQVKNLAIVFAPGFLRNPSDDPMEMLNSAKYEIQFTVNLFNFLLKTK